MPSPQNILESLTTIANGWWPVAMAWHLILGGLLLSLIFRWRPSTRLVATVLTLPFVSVSALAWRTGNAFNGVVMAGLSLALAVVANRLPRDPTYVASLRLVLPGAALVAFGWAYPHFLRTESPWSYLYASPFGVIPCPTLSAVMGMTLMLGLFGSRPWSLLVAAVSSFYGAFGALGLGVTIDVVLLAGAVGLALAALGSAEKHARAAAAAVARGAARSQNVAGGGI